MRPGRILGLDVARCLALLGMVAVHVLPADSWVMIWRTAVPLRCSRCSWG